MKSLFSMLAAAFAVTFILSGCAEIVEPQERSERGPALQADSNPHPYPDPICSDLFDYKLKNSTTGSYIVDNCGGNGPCPPTTTEWGDVLVFNGIDDLYLNITLPQGWFADGAVVYFGDINNLTIVNGIPQADASWTSSAVNPVSRQPQIKVPISGMVGTCGILAMEVSVQQLDFFSGTIAGSETDLIMEKINGTVISQYCVAACGPDTTTTTAGNCSGCESENTVSFIDCDEVMVSSCKDLSNVVLVYTDCTAEKFDNLSNKSGIFSGTGGNAGKEISHIYVKSGCYKSGEGPGYGLRFDGPCLEASCASNSSTGGNGGGGKGKGKGKNK